MTTRALRILQSTPLKGALVGLAATQALDFVSTYLYQREGPAARFRENSTRGFLHAYERAILKLGRAAGRRPSRRAARTWGLRFHKTFGLLGGLQYVLLRKRFPAISRFGGLAFGTGFFAIADELLMPLLGLTPGPRKFSWRVHARGAISHVLYGVAAEMTARFIERAAPSSNADAEARASATAA
jgi:hypothetical protein